MSQTPYKELIAAIKSTPCAGIIVFDGYSGLGYAQPDKVKAEMRQQITELFGLNDTVFVVAGATADGIGSCYDIADELIREGYDIRKVGIVSEAATVNESWGKALPDEQAARLDHLVLVADPDQTWQVLNELGASLMVGVAFDAGVQSRFVFVGGGEVANGELAELEQRLNVHPCGLVSVKVHHGEGSFAPRADKAAKKYEQVLAKKGVDAAILAVNGTAGFAEGVTVGAVPPRVAVLELTPEPMEA